MREYKFEIGEKVYAITGDMSALFVGRVVSRGYTDWDDNAYAVSSPAFKGEVFLEEGLISAETARAMLVD